MVYSYLIELKLFYMISNEDGRICMAVDCLMPQLEELIVVIN